MLFRFGPKEISIASFPIEKCGSHATTAQDRTKQHMSSHGPPVPTQTGNLAITCESFGAPGRPANAGSCSYCCWRGYINPYLYRLNSLFFQHIHTRHLLLPLQASTPLRHLHISITPYSTGTTSSSCSSSSSSSPDIKTLTTPSHICYLLDRDFFFNHRDNDNIFIHLLLLT